MLGLDPSAAVRRRLEDLGVCEAGMERLRIYATLLEKWTARINLIARGTVPDLWTRHVLDSAQMLPILDRCVSRETSLADLGTGGGIPGLILAAVSDRPVTLVDSDQRKLAFCAEAAREMGVDATICAGRIEEIPPLSAPMITSRALAPLDRLMPWLHRHLGPGGQALLLKGRDAEAELQAVAGQWVFHVKHHPSLTEPQARILHVTDLVPA